MWYVDSKDLQFTSDASIAGQDFVDFLPWLFNENRRFFGDLPNNTGERKNTCSSR